MSAYVTLDQYNAAIVGKADPIQSLSPEEQRLFRMYGKLPNKQDLLKNKLKVDSMPLGTLGI